MDFCIDFYSFYRCALKVAHSFRNAALDSRLFRTGQSGILTGYPLKNAFRRLLMAFQRGAAYSEPIEQASPRKEAT